MRWWPPILLAALLIALYVAVAAAAWRQRAAAIYPGAGPFATGGIPGAARWEHVFGTGPGDRVYAFYMPPPGGSQPAPAVVVFHGNGELAGDKEDIVAFYRERGFGALVVEYRGFGGAGGEPDFRPIMADALAFYDRLAERPEIDRARLLAHGISLGGSFAAELSRERPLAGLVLHSTFTSMSAMVWRRWLPGFVFGGDYRTLDAVRTYEGPVFVVHGTADTVIPFAHGRALAAAARHATFAALEGEDHVIPVSEPALGKPLTAWLAEVGRAAPSLIPDKPRSGSDPGWRARRGLDPEGSPGSPIPFRPG